MFRLRHLLFCALVLLPVQSVAGDWQVEFLEWFGGEWSHAADVNDYGHVTGTYRPSGIDRAFIYDGTTIKNLGTLNNSYKSVGMGINNSDHVVGASSYALSGGIVQTHAFYFDGTPMIDLSPDGPDFSYAYAINDSDQVTGIAGSHVFIYADDAMQDIDSFGSYQSYGFDINSSGTVVGRYKLTAVTPDHAIRGDLTGLEDLVSITPGNYNEATAINDAGDIVGSYGLGDYAFLYKDGVTTFFGPDETGIEPSDINNSDCVVGHAFDVDFAYYYPFFYDGTIFSDLNMMARQFLTAGDKLETASAISDTGWVCGYGYHNSEQMAFRVKLLAVPEPPCITAFLCGIGSLSAIWWRRRLMQ